jgi:CO/xanthine dehydrogenase FAD-binding subunit
MRAYLPDYDFRVPATVGEALTFLAQEPGVWQPFAGGTDLMVLLEAGKLAPTKFISLWGLSELHGITITDDEVIVGALTTYTELQNDPVLQSEFPLLCQAAGLTGSVAIQNRGTLGGNIANASPAADSLPALLVYEARLELISTSGTRIVPYQSFHTGYKTFVMRNDEIIRAILLPRTTAGWFQASRKVGTRRAQAISKVSLAAMAQIENNIISDVRLAFGSVAPVPLRCVKAEAALKSQPIDEAVISAARTELANALRPIDDLRSTAEYRLQVAGNLLEEFLWKAAGQR